jgi:hypothetical protein
MHVSISIRIRAPDKRIGKGKDKEQQQSSPQREQDEIPQPPMPRGALYATLEEHQRADLTGRCNVTPQQMHKNRYTERRKAG